MIPPLIAAEMSESVVSTSTQLEGSGGGDDQEHFQDSTLPATEPQEHQHRDPSSPIKPSDTQSKRTRIRYRTEYRDRFTSEVVWEGDSKDDIDDHVAAAGGDSRGDLDPIFDVLTTYHARSDSASPKRFNSSDSSRERDGPPPRSLGVPASYTLRIYSQAIRNALNSVVRYYPSQSLAGDVLEIQWPYTVLVHHYDELVAFRKRILAEDPKNVCVREKNAPEEIEALLSHLDRTIMDDIRAEKSRNERGFASFENYWYAFKPGTTVMTKTREVNYYKSWVVREVTGGSLVNPPTDWQLLGWSFDFNGTYLGRIDSSSIIDDMFSGEICFQDREHRFIHDTENIDDEEAKKLIEYGKAYWSLLEKKCSWHTGNSCNFPYNKIDGLVMTDIQQYYALRPLERPEFRDDLDIRRWITDCMCAVCKQRAIKLEAGTSAHTGIFADYIDLTLIDNPELTEHQYLLCPTQIPAFVFKTRTWGEIQCSVLKSLPGWLPESRCIDFFANDLMSDNVHVKNLKEPKFQQHMINNLVADSDRITSLKALAESFVRINKDGNRIERQAWAADFVEGKGTGLTFLLHGGPGVGKTYTAECIAEYTQRPLMVLTSSDIGTNPSEVELNLTNHFQTAKSWGAVLLIDEADVFMERRSTSDLERNSLVAGFLRALEFYDGILFLTTNRVGSFDDAFISRIHIKLYYRDFTNSERQRVWKTFIDKLERDSLDEETGKIYMRVSLPAQEYIEGEQIRDIKWNGREIRNAFQTAVSLAEHENKRDREGTILLTDQHLRSVVALSKDFKDYMDELHGSDEAKRARRRKERLDDF